MKIMNSLAERMFGYPRGLLGNLGGRILARGKDDVIQWVVSLLELQSDDRVLEVGFGPGVGIQHVAAIAPDGFIAGVDPSKVMFNQARRRNRQAIEAGRVELTKESATSLSYRPDTFDSAFSINSMQLWPDKTGGARELYRVVKPGGTIAIAFTEAARAQRLAAELPDLLTDIGVEDVRVETHGSDVCVVGLV